MTGPLLSRIATALAVVALPLGMLSIWLAAYVGDTERYVATVGPLADDPAVKRAAVDYLERETLAVLSPGDQLGSTLRTLDLSCIGVDAGLLGGIADLASAFLEGTPLGGSIREQIEPQLRATVRQAITQAVESPTFAAVWVDANRQAHREVLAALEDKPSPGSGADEILIPLTRISQMVTGLLPCPNLITPATVEQIRSSLTLVNTEDLRAAHPGYQVLQTLRWVLPVLFVLGVAAGLLLAGSWRRRLWQLGLGFVIGMGALELALVLIKRTITSAGVDEEILGAVWRALTESLHLTALAVAVVSAVVGAAAWFLTRSQDS